MRISLVVAICCSLAAVSFRPALGGEPTPIRLIAEAEGFTVEAGPWKVVPYRENYFASTFAISTVNTP